MPGQVVGVLGAAQPQRPGEDPLTQRRSGLDGRDDARVEPLVEPRHGDHHRGVDLGHVRRQALDRRLGVGDGAAPPQRDDLAGRALGHVRERQEREEEVVLVEVDRLDATLEVDEDVAVGQHHSLGIGGRPGGVHDGRHLVAPVAPPGLRPLADLAGIGGGEVEDVIEADRAGRELAPVVDHDHVLERRALGAHLVDLGGLLQVLDEDQPRLDVVDHVGRLVRLDRRIDRAGHGPEGERAKVGGQPGRAGPAHDADAVPVADAEVLEAHRDLGDPVPGLTIAGAAPRHRLLLRRPAGLALRLRQLPAQRLLLRVTQHRVVDERHQAVGEQLGRDVARLDLGLHHRSDLRISSTSCCAMISRWIWLLPS